MTKNFVMNIIAAVDNNRGIGFEDKLLYWIPNDLKRFKKITMGHTVVMGRKTFESLPNGALPGRKNIVLSHSDKQFKGAITLHSLTEAMSLCEDEEIFVIGGESIYKEALPYADSLFLTEIDDEAEQVDSFFPAIDENEWKVVECQECEADDICPHPYRFKEYQRLK